MLKLGALQYSLKTPHLGCFSFGDLVMFLAGLLIIMGWLVPLHILPWVSWHNEVMVFAAVLLLAGHFLFSVTRKNARLELQLPVTIIPFVILLLSALFQGITGQISFVGDVFVIGLYMTLCVITLTLGFHAVQSSRDEASEKKAFSNVPALTWLAAILVVGGFASTVVALVQSLDLWENSGWISRMYTLRRPGGNMGQPNHLATLLLMAVASLLFLYETRRLNSHTGILIFLILCVGIAATESRTGLLNFVVLMGWWFYKRTQVNFRLSYWVVVLFGTGFLMSFWYWPAFIEAFQGLNTSAKVNTEAGLRLVVWPQLLEAVSLKPWLGWGLGKVAEAHNAVVHAYNISEPFSYSHNIILDLALGIGVPLTALLVISSGLWLWRRVRATDHLPSWYCIAIILPIAVHSMLEFPFAYAYLLVFPMFALGALEAMTQNREPLYMKSGSAATIFLGVSLLAAYSVVEYVAIEEDFRIARFEATHMGKTPEAYQKPRIILLTQLGALLDGARISPKPGMTNEELRLAQKVALRYPWTATQNRYALSLALNGNSAEAIRQLRVMRAMHGEKKYMDIKAYWMDLAQSKYPQLRTLELP